MQLTKDESKALALIALLVVLAGGVRLLDRTEPLDTDAAALDLEVVEAASRALLAAEQRRRTPLTLGERLDPNSEDTYELARLPGIGRAMAERIVAERASGGAFASVGDLTRVPGIGPGTVARLAPFLELPNGSAGVPPTQAADASGGRSSAGPGGHPFGLDLASARPGRPPGAEALPLRVDPNRATEAELEQLPGIGPVIAGRIVAFRDSVGPFLSISDLERVAGIGPATLERLAPHIRLP